MYIKLLRSFLPAIGVMIIASIVFLTVNKTHLFAAQESVVTCDSKKNVFCISPRLHESTDTLHAATIPKIATPSWLAPPESAVRTVTYSVQTRGVVNVDIEEFKSIANQTFNDSRGWSRLGVRFDQIDNGGEFTLWLSEASQMTTFSANGCDTTYSCNVGRDVIINQDRWVNGTPSWSGGGGDLASYRQMVLNHETGHWLGHGHTYCKSAGQPSTVMQQQSMSLQGCNPNPWPLQSEMYSPTLGIRS